ncbi:MAG: hypothetical protein L0I88_06955 [Alkalibacterium sp.]|nr:hypothetical protein [Alkalibacterium sp.]
MNYSSQKQADFLDTSEVQGDSNWKKIERASTKEMKTFFSTALILRILWSIGAALIVWLVVRWVRPNFWPQLADQIQLNPLKTLGFGALGLVFIPMLSILFIITIIGIPLSLILLTLYSVTLYISKIIVSVYFSRSLQKRLNGSTRHAFWVFLLALILLTSLGSLPIVGLIIRLFIAALGIGATGFLLKNRQTRP